MPSHIISVLECPVVVDIVAICDSILYKVRQQTITATKTATIFIQNVIKLENFILSYLVSLVLSR